jgi:hypothetical protein
VHESCSCLLASPFGGEVISWVRPSTSEAEQHAKKWGGTTRCSGRTVRVYVWHVAIDSAAEAAQDCRMSGIVLN